MTALHYITFAIFIIAFIGISLVLYRRETLNNLEKEMSEIDPKYRWEREVLAELMTKYNNFLNWKLWK